MHQIFKQMGLHFLPTGLQRDQPKTAGEDHQAKGDPPGALPARGTLHPALRHLRTHHRVTSHPASVEPHQEAGLRDPAGIQSLPERLRNAHVSEF